MSVLQCLEKKQETLANIRMFVDQLYHQSTNTKVLDAYLCVLLNTLDLCDEDTQKEVKEWKVYQKVREARERIEREENSDEE